MKVFVIHAEAGSGHKKIAEAIYGFLTPRFKQADFSIFDILNFTPGFFKYNYSVGYLFLISKFKWLWGLFFYFADTKWLSLINKDLRECLNRLFCRRFIDFILKEQPDVIISTHFLVSELVSYLKGKYHIKTRLITMVTDFGVHNFWISQNVDLYIAGCDRTKSILEGKGVEGSKIEVWGIPVREQFSKRLDKVELRKSLKIEQDSFVVIIVTGGIGIGPIEEIAIKLKDKVTVIAICGTNKNLSKNLAKIGYKNLKIFGWVENIEELMAASDIIVTKPGGSTITECLFLNLPMIYFSIIPGQEANNANIMVENGVGIISKSPDAIADTVFSFKDSQNKINEFKSNILKNRKVGFYEKLDQLIKNEILQNSKN